MLDQFRDPVQLDRITTATGSTRPALSGPEKGNGESYSLGDSLPPQAFLGISNPLAHASLYQELA
jgi:hypothetical protein